MYIPRTVEPMIQSMTESFPCIVIYGARQVGKSTTASMIFDDQLRKVTLDDADDRNLALTDPKSFLDAWGWPLMIDEIQKAPHLLDEIKKRIDDQRMLWMKNGEPRQLMYVLTGSNRFELQQGISESLAGRCGVIEMAAFSQMEKQMAKSNRFTPEIPVLLQRERETDIAYRTRPELFADIFEGGMPDICTGMSDRSFYFKSYIDTYIEKDVRKLIAAPSEMQFRNFLSILALRTAQELHYDVIANAVGIDTRTCKRWISVLETSGIIVLLQPYLTNRTNRIIKAPKLYFMDTGLCAYLCKWPDSEMLEKGAMCGSFFETWVVSELMKNFYAFNADPREYLYYYRDTDQKEIDLLYVERDTIYPIEIKTGTTPKNPTRHFRVLKKYQQPIGTGLVIDTCDKMRPVSDDAYYFPAYLLGM